MRNGLNFKIRPRGRNKRAASVGKDYNKMESSFSMPLPEDLQTLSLQGVVITRNGDLGGAILDVSSVS